MVDLRINNGKVVLPDCVIDATLLIEKGKIVGVTAQNTTVKAEQTIDAKGKYILPGGIDPHTHLATSFMGVNAKDDYFTGTKAASWGGTTTIIGFATPPRGESTLEAVSKTREKADKETVIDYSLHPTIVNLNSENIGLIKTLIEMGMPSFKLYLVYRKEGVMADDGVLLQVFKETIKHRGLVGCHAENVSMIEHLVAEALKNGNKSAIYHAKTRPPITEAETINRMIYMANFLNAPYFNFHLTIKEGVEMFREARAKGQPMYAETCTQYLVNSENDLRRPDGINFICTPPLRTKDDSESLWRGLADGCVSVVSSDQCAFSREMKQLGKDSFDLVPNGLPGLEFRMPILFSEGFMKKRISLSRFSEVTSTNAAKIFGLYPKKGVIRVGSDADVVIFDPKLERTISSKDSLYDMDWCPYEGMTVKGWPSATIVKGKVIWNDGVFIGKAGEGEFLKRKLASDLFRKPME
jgi:dihydropyrimidinase